MRSNQRQCGPPLVRAAGPIVAILIALLTGSTAGAAESARDMLRRGHDAMQAGDTDQAIELYEKVLTIDPGDSAAKASLKNATRIKEITEFLKKIEPTCRATGADIETQKRCLKRYFVYDGRAVHPLIVQDFTTWLSDGGDQVVAINMADSQVSNRYCCADSYTIAPQDGYKIDVKIDLVEDFSSQQISETECGPNGCWFSYRFEGTTDNGVTVLRTWDRGGGSGIFSSLLFLMVSERRALQDEDASTLVWNKRQVILEKLGELPLGDRVQHTIDINGDFLVLDGRRIKLAPDPGSDPA